MVRNSLAHCSRLSAHLYNGPMDFPRSLVLAPRDIWWEKNGVFNPAAMELEGKIHLLYRAVGADHISRFGLAISDDGESFTRFDEPILEADELNPIERLGIEDPRAVRIDRDIYITYTAASVYQAGTKTIAAPSLNTTGTPWRVRACLAKTRDFRSFKRLGVMVSELDTKDAVLFSRKILGHYWLLHRIVPAIYLARSNDLRQ